MARSLFLHLSALSNSEYENYVEALRDVLDEDGEPDRPDALKLTDTDEELENRCTQVPVVRAWMKGRFRDVGVEVVDQVCFVFAISSRFPHICLSLLQAFALLAPQMPAKQISGGQILAVLRLLMHARAGRPVCEGNVFIQGQNFYCFPLTMLIYIDSPSCAVLSDSFKIF